VVFVALILTPERPTPVSLTALPEIEWGNRAAVALDEYRGKANIAARTTANRNEVTRFKAILINPERR
jgi:hypothetical protein